MSWRNRLLPASFRGVPFKVKRADTQVGRRNALHEYPQRDDAWPEDMGRLARRFSVEGQVIGENYDQARDRLIDALEAKGPGELVHPYYGRKTVSLVSPVRISESASDDGGVARFSLEFVEASDNTEPSSRADTRDRVDKAADEANRAAANDFAGKFGVHGKPDFVSASAMDRVRGVVDTMHSVRQAMLSDMAIVTDYVNAAKALAGGVAGILRAPVDLANRILGLVAGIRGLALAPEAALSGLRKLFGYGNNDAAVRHIPRTTPSRIAQANNAVAINTLVQRTAVIEAVRASSRMDFTSYDQAIAVRDELGEQIDVLADVAPEDVYRALVTLRVAMVQDIAGRGADKARISQATMPSTMPALVVAYRIYGDATRAEEIVVRNAGRIRHPGFVPGGTSLEILRD